MKDNTPQRHHRGAHHHHPAAASNSELDRDTRRLQFHRVFLILPAILFGLGLVVWGWGMNYNRAIQVPNEKLVNCGLWLMGICGGVFALLLIADWTRKIRQALYDARFERRVRREMREINSRRHQQQDGEAEQPTSGTPAP